jgi:hypothetical protein
MTERLLAWHGSAELKAEVTERLRVHREADDFIQGNYQLFDPDSPLGYKGCALGCTLPRLDADDLDALSAFAIEIERQYSIDFAIADLIDDLFEAQPLPRAGIFAVAVIEAIPVGADLSGIDVGSYYDHDFHDDPEGAAARLIAELTAAPVLHLDSVG